jgi:hypothetical protein
MSRPLPLRQGGGVLAAVVLTALLASCTDNPPAASEASPTTSTVPNQVPDETPAVTDAPRPTATDVVLSFAAWNESTGAVEASGYVSPVVENGGTCTLDLELDGRTVSVSAAAEADATTTTCGSLRAEPEQLAPGTWTAVLRYESATTAGTSEPLTVQVGQ